MPNTMKQISAFKPTRSPNCCLIEYGRRGSHKANMNLWKFRSHTYFALFPGLIKNYEDTCSCNEFCSTLERTYFYFYLLNSEIRHVNVIPIQLLAQLRKTHACTCSFRALLVP